MTHLPLTLGEHTTALGPVTIIRFGKNGVWAFDADGCQWSVATGIHGKHFKNPLWDITGRVEPDRPDPNWIFSADAVPKLSKVPRELWIDDGGCTWDDRAYAVKYCTRGSQPVRMIEAAPIEADLARVTAERDEAVALLQDADRVRPDFMSHSESCWYAAKNEFLAKIGAKP